MSFARAVPLDGRFRYPTDGEKIRLREGGRAH